MSVAEIADAVSKAVQRQPAWDRTTVSRFLKNEHPTYELMLAFCTTFKELLQPVFIADTEVEARELLQVSRRIRGSAAPTEKDVRRAALVKAREQIEQSAADQTSRLESTDEGIRNRRRTRGVGRSRPPSS